VLILVGIILWNGVATHTATGLRQTLTQAAYSLRGGSPESKSGDVSYSLFSVQTLTPQQVLAQYVQYTLKATAAQRRTGGGFYPQNLIDRLDIKIVPLPNLPVTSVGKVVEYAGINVSTINSVMRSSAARLLQVFVLLGLLSALLTKRRRGRPFVELIALSCGALVIVTLQVVLPVISVDYGVLRAFLQALITFAPFVAVGSVLVFKFLGPVWRLRAASVVAISFFLSLTGALPQALGGYPAQLHLNNDGQYYDIYYLHPQEITAIEWLQGKVDSRALGDVQSEVETDRYTFNQVRAFTGLSPINDIYPTLLRQGAFVFIGYAAVQKGQATFNYDGDLITYQYPMNFLNGQDDLLYSSNGARIYR
jgi:uncharacterized membrane protein